MNIVLLSGGSGKRLWPLSNDIRSKQFLPLFYKDGEYESMMQRVYRQIKEVDQNASVTIATSKSQVSLVKNQLGPVDISIEPCRRDTFPAIALSAAYLKDVKHLSEEELMIVCPVDPYVETDYFKALSELEKNAKKEITLLGIKPTYPSEKYGYILPEENQQDNNTKVKTVKCFQEKPTEEVASKLIEQGALWNSGVFAISIDYVLRKAHQELEFTDYYDLYERYAQMPKISFDYAVVEKEKEIYMMEFHGTWKDLGTWNTLTEAMTESVKGNAVLGQDCENVHIINETDRPILCMGLKDVVVAASAEGILVSDKGKSSYMKPYVEAFGEQLHYAEKSWGSYRVIDETEESLTIKITLKVGHEMNYHSHEHRDETWTVLSGKGKSVVDGMMQEVCAGDVITIQAGCRHKLVADTELKVIEVQLGKEISVHDKRKYEYV